MTPDQARQAVETGLAQAYRLVDTRVPAAVTGDLGLANTTPSTALVAALTHTPASEVTGRGAGSDERCSPTRSTSSGEPCPGWTRTRTR